MSPSSQIAIYFCLSLNDFSKNLVLVRFQVFIVLRIETKCLFNSLSSEIKIAPVANLKLDKLLSKSKWWDVKCSILRMCFYAHFIGSKIIILPKKITIYINIKKHIP